MTIFRIDHHQYSDMADKYSNAHILSSKFTAEMVRDRKRVCVCERERNEGETRIS